MFRSRSQFAMLAFGLTFVTALPSSASAQSTAPGVEEGDLFVSAASYLDNFGQPHSPYGIFRVRDGVVEPFSLGPASPFTDDGVDPAFFAIPRQVIVDSKGRVVWLASLPQTGPEDHIGLFRASDIGATPERLAIFRVGNQDLKEAYPNPFPDVQLASQSHGFPIVGLHLAQTRRVEIDDDVNGGLPRVVTEDQYVMGLIEGDATRARAGSGGIGNFTGTRTVAYGSDSGTWDESLPPPIHRLPSPADTRSWHPVDMASHGGDLYSIDVGAGFRRSSTPLRVDASGAIDLGSAGSFEFRLNLRLFGGDHDLPLARNGSTSAFVDDTRIPNIPSGVPPEYPNPPRHDMPGQFFQPLSALYGVIYDEQLGLVLTAGGENNYYTRVSQTLLNDEPGDDASAYFYDPYLDFLPVPSLEVTRMFTQEDKQRFVQDGKPPLPFNGSVISAPGGGALIGIPGNLFTGSDSVVRVTESGPETLASGLIAPAAVAAFPTDATPPSGTAIVIRIDSPVDAILTAPDGQQIGVDPLTGLTINDFGEHGFDSGPGEPRFFAIEDPILGNWDVDLLGTGDGPFTISVYGIDLDQPVGSLARVTDNAQVGSQNALRLAIGPGAAVVDFGPPPILTGDYNNNGLVEQEDLDLVLANWGNNAALVPATWTNDLPTGNIDQEELDRVLANWGTATAAASAAVVPEPATAVLLVIALAGAAVVRRRKSWPDATNPGKKSTVMAEFAFLVLRAR